MSCYLSYALVVVLGTLLKSYYREVLSVSKRGVALRLPTGQNTEPVVTVRWVHLIMQHIGAMSRIYAFE